jgi:hypothetical protein
MDSPTAINPQPRIDTLTVHAVTGAQGRRTEYAGTIWFGEPPKLGGFLVTTRTGAANIDTAIFLPDSLPYRTDMAAQALVACTIAVQSAASEAHQFIASQAALVADPRNPAVSWVSIHLEAFAYTPVALSYRVDVIVPPEAVMAGDAPSG